MFGETGKTRELRFTTKDLRRSTVGDLDSTLYIDNDFDVCLVAAILIQRGFGYTTSFTKSGPLMGDSGGSGP